MTTAGDIGIGMTVLTGTLKERSPADRRAVLATLADAGIDHIHAGDHVSFHSGTGWDGLITATTLLHLQDAVPVHMGVYQPLLRHPVLVARELSTMLELVGGRLVLGVGIGGDDPKEVIMCGVNPKTRGRRMDEHLPILKALLAGETVTHAGEFFALDEVRIVPAPDPPVAILVGGRSNAAIRRTARHGDGWLGIWVSASRFAETVASVAEAAAEEGRGDVDWRHGMIVWCGLGRDKAKVRRAIEREMKDFYRIDYDRFEKWSPAGSPADLAEFVAPYIEAGARDVSLIAHGESLEDTIASVAEVKRLLGL